MSQGDSLSFPDGPKLELDALLDQLMERAQGVKQAQVRLRGLLRAIELVTGDLAIDTVLHRIVEAACDLAGARYGGLGVINHDGGLEQFIHHGLDAAQVAKIPHLPEGKGLLGALISYPEQIRLDDIAADERSSGFPAGHPPMSSFLGVPIRVRGEVFGNLYLTESLTGHFSLEDEELVQSLAIAAGTAITNARLYEESGLQQRWLQATADISAQLISDSGEDPLRTIARLAREVADADLVSIGLITPDEDALMIEVADGLGADGLIGQRFPMEETFAAKAIESQTPMLVLSAFEDANSPAAHLAAGWELGPVMVIPLSGAAQSRGALTIARQRGRQVFSQIDLQMASAFADHVSVALELADARNDRHRMVLLEDRDRIARDLHDHVIQELFAVGLSLESSASMARDNPTLAAKIRDRVSDIDRTIRQIRTSIFQLRGALASPPAGLRQRLLEIASELTPNLGFAPSLVFAGAVDAVVNDDLAREVIACVREGLSNIAKHAHAHKTDIDISVSDGAVVIAINDDGRGITDAVRSSGLTNLRERAERRHGSFSITSPPGGGTQLIWKAPIT